MPASNRDKLVKALEALVGRGNVLSSPEDLLCYSYDASAVRSRLPDFVAFPSSAADVQKLVKFAAANGLKVIPRGAGTGLSGGTIPAEGGIVVPFTRMNHILEIDAENLTALTEPGVVTADLCAAVEARQLFYPPDPGSVKVCTLGGNVAENAGGLRGLKYGVTKDYVLGLELVLPSGDIITTGGKARKDVAGYNLTALMVGSEGTLGIFTRILLKLLPLPEAKRTLLATFRRSSDSASCIANILCVNHIIPATLEFLDRVTMKCINDFLGAKLPADADSMLLIEVDGARSACEEDAGKLLRICRESQAQSVVMARDTQEAEALTLARRSALPALSRARTTTILEDISVPASRLSEMLASIDAAASRYHLQIGVFGHAGDGNLHPTILTDERDRDEMERVHRAVGDIFEVAVQLGGTITGEHGIGISKMAYLPRQLDSRVLATMKSIKHLFNPDNMLNPGKIFTGDT